MPEPSTRADLDVLLDALAETSESLDGVTFRGGSSSVEDARRREVIEQFRSSPEAQVTLFQLALELKADAADSPEALRADLLEFAADVRDGLGANVLRAAADHRDRLSGVPDGLLEPSRVEQFDPD